MKSKAGYSSPGAYSWRSSGSLSPDLCEASESRFLLPLATGKPQQVLHPHSCKGFGDLCPELPLHRCEIETQRGPGPRSHSPCPAKDPRC